MKITQHLSEHNFYKILAVVWTILIFYFCLDDAPNVPKITFQYKDKVVHFVFYFIFVFFWIKSLKTKQFNLVILILLLGIILGIAIEFLQENFTRNRTFDWYDILANSVGATASFVYLKKFVQ